MYLFVIFVCFYLHELTLFVCVSGDDHVTCYMGENVDAGE